MTDAPNIANLLQRNATICDDCAENLGGVLPKNPLFFLDEGICAVCEEEKVIGYMNGYIWPGHPPEYGPEWQIIPDVDKYGWIGRLWRAMF